MMTEFLLFENPNEDVDEVSPTPDAPQIYVTVKGDTLWGIAKKFYGSGLKYKKIMTARYGED